MSSSRNPPPPSSSSADDTSTTTKNEKNHMDCDDDDENNNNDQVVDIPLEYHGSSLPHVEEIRQDNSNNNSSSRFVYYLLYGFAICIVASFVIGFTVSKNNNNNNTTTSTSSNKNYYDNNNNSNNNNNNNPDDNVIRGSSSSSSTTPTTPPPTAATTTEKDDDDDDNKDMKLLELMTYLHEEYDIASLFDATSPQYAAAQWMVFNDPAKLSIPTTIGIPDDMFVQRYVIVLHYLALNGHLWRKQLSFLSDKSVCEWNGWIGRQYDVYPGGVFCDDNGNVNKLLFTFNGLTGTLPSEIGLLTSLTRIELQENEIRGPIPSTICKLHQLQVLLLGNNQFNGNIPSCFGDGDNSAATLSKLRDLQLSHNQLTGPFPPQFGRQLGQQLQHLFVDFNQLTGNPTETIFNQLTSLQTLVAQHNLFQGPIHDYNFLYHSVLQVLDLSDNQFELLPNDNAAAVVPNHFFALPKLRILDLSNNTLKGPWPFDQIPVNSSKLEVLSLYHNQLSGTIPTTIAYFQHLVHLDLGDNHWTGPIPAEIGNMRNLTALFLSNNPTLDNNNNNGQSVLALPDSLQNLQNLQELSLRNTNRTGYLPYTMNYPKLNLLDLSDNHLKGNIPRTGEWNMPELHFLLLNGNTGITGDIPTEWKQSFPKLGAVFLDGTSLTADFDETLCQLPHFRTSDYDRPQIDDLQGGYMNEMHELFADCDGPSATVKCSCCHCCNAQELKGCSQPMLSRFDLQWEDNYERLRYQFTNDTYYWIGFGDVEAEHMTSTPP